ALFDAYDTIQGMLSLCAPLVEQTHLRQDVITARLDRGFLDATTLMEEFIRRGVPMRTAHELVGQLVRQAESQNCTLAALPEADWQTLPHGVAEGLREKLGVDNAIAAFQSYGSTGREQVREQLRWWQSQLAHS
ncbi:MAG: argininosuccinate lyase, partial [Gemmataceae bacterium]